MLLSFYELLNVACRTDHKILKLVSLSEDLSSTEWQLADVRANRGGPPIFDPQIILICIQKICEFFSISCREGQSQAVQDTVIKQVQLCNSSTEESQPLY